MGASIGNAPDWALPKIHLDVALYQEADGHWVAHCLQLDILGISRQVRDDAYHEVAKLCADQILYAIENDSLGYLFKPAPPDILRRFLNGQLIAVTRFNERKLEGAGRINGIEFQVGII